MKKLILLLSISFAFLSCKKSATTCQYSDSSKVASASEIASIQSYLSGQGITTAVQHSSGLFYEITNAGATAKPGLCSGIFVKYVGRLTNGSVFETNTTGSTFTLGQLIVGWQKGIPLIGKGGTIKLYIPPSLGYGSQAVGSIPANSILIFDLQLTDVY